MQPNPKQNSPKPKKKGFFSRFSLNLASTSTDEHFQIHSTSGDANSGMPTAPKLQEVSTEALLLEKLVDLQTQLTNQQTKFEQHQHSLLMQQAKQIEQQRLSEQQQFSALLKGLRNTNLGIEADSEVSDKPEIDILMLLQKQESIQQTISELKQQLALSEKQSDLAVQRLANLETQQHVLLDEYQAKQYIVEQQKFIQNQAALRAFYHRVQLKLTELFLACKVVNSGMVERKVDNINLGLSGSAKVAKTVGEIADSSVISLAGTLIDIALPGAGLATRIGAKVISLGAKGVSVGLEVGNKAHHKREQVKITRLSSLTVSITAMDQLAEEVARRLTLRYQDQIKLLTTETQASGLRAAASTMDLLYNRQNGGAENLAECAVGRMLEGMRSGDVDPDKPEPLVEQLMEAVFYSNKKQGIPLLKHQFIQTLDKQQYSNWTDHGIFQHSGIKTVAGYFYHNPEHEDLCSNVKKYGYREGLAEEARALQLQKSTIPLSHWKPSLPMPNQFGMFSKPTVIPKQVEQASHLSAKRLSF